MAESVDYNLSEKEENALLELPGKQLPGPLDEEMEEAEEHTVQLPLIVVPSTSGELNTQTDIHTKEKQKEKRETQEERAARKKEEKRRERRQEEKERLQYEEDERRRKINGKLC